jgi:putative transposase
MSINYWQTFDENAYYHVYNRTNGKDLLYLSHDNYQFFLKKWQQYFDNYLDTYAYCLMPNHFHFIVKVKPVDADFKTNVQKEGTTAANAFLFNKITVDAFLEDQFKRFFTSYAKSFNKQHNRHGSLFETRFKRIKLKTLDHLRDKIAYVHHNPLHHNMSTSYGGWLYSSYQSYLSDKPTKIKRFEGLSLFGGKEAFVLFHQNFHTKWMTLRGLLFFDDEMESPI